VTLWLGRIRHSLAKLKHSRTSYVPAAAGRGIQRKSRSGRLHKLRLQGRMLSVPRGGDLNIFFVAAEAWHGEWRVFGRPSTTRLLRAPTSC